MGDFKTDLNKRNLLISAFHERKNYCENWILRIEAELQDETLNEKAISKKMIGLEAWENLHPVIEKYIELSDDWDKLHFPELWKIVTGDRELVDVVYNGIRQLKSNIIERRDSAGLPVLHKDMKDPAYGRDSKDYQEWNLLNELENSLHEAYRQDQPQVSKAEDWQGAEPVKAGKAKSNTAKAVVNLFFDKHINDSNSKYHVLRESQGKGTHQDELVGLYKLFIKEHPEIKIKVNTFKKNYLNEWRQHPKK